MTSPQNLLGRLSMVVRVNVVLNRTVVADSDLRFDNLCGSHLQSQRVTLTLKMTTAQAVETSVTVDKNNPIQDYIHPDDHTQPTNEMIPGFKPFTTKCRALIMNSTFLVPIVSAI